MGDPTLYSILMLYNTIDHDLPTFREAFHARAFGMKLMDQAARRAKTSRSLGFPRQTSWLINLCSSMSPSGDAPNYGQSKIQDIVSGSLLIQI